MPSLRLTLSTLAFLLWLPTPPAAKAQLFGISDNDPRWGAWTSAPNFPGIEIRVACGTYVPSTGDAQWSFQFRNMYPKKVYLAYQEEASDSTGKPPTFDSPGGRNLDPGEMSDMYTDYLQGSCAARKQIFIRVVSISDDDGNQTDAKAGAPQDSAVAGGSLFTHKPDDRSSANPNQANSRSVQTNGSSASANGGSFASTGQQITVVNQNGNAANGSPSIVGTWNCESVTNYPNGTSNGPHEDSRTFYANGTWTTSSNDDQFTWSQQGTNLVFHVPVTEHNQFDHSLTGQLIDSSHMTWTGESPFDEGVFSVTCSR